MTITKTEIESDILPVVVRADWVRGAAQGHWNYAAYATLPDDGNRYEILDGVLLMTPSPSFEHQNANAMISHYLVGHVKLKGLGQVLAAPFDVELPSGDVVQPDVLVVLKEYEERITQSRLVGAPDLVVEIASPSTAGYDRSKKQAAYTRAEVPEYWVVDTAAKTVELLVLQLATTTQPTEYQSQGVFRGKATLPSSLLTDFKVKVEQFFA